MKQPILLTYFIVTSEIEVNIVRECPAHCCQILRNFKANQQLELNPRLVFSDQSQIMAQVKGKWEKMVKEIANLK